MSLTITSTDDDDATFAINYGRRGKPWMVTPFNGTGIPLVVLQGNSSITVINRSSANFLQGLYAQASTVTKQMD